MTNVPAPRVVIYGLSCSHCPERGIRYVGQTRQGPDARLREHLKNARRANGRDKGDFPCYRWIRKHGPENIFYTVLEEVASVEDLNSAEARWIKSLGTHRKPGLNCGTGYFGPGPDSRRALGAKLSDEQVVRVIDLLWKGYPARVIAEEFSVSWPAIYSISRWGSYRDVPRTIGPRMRPRTEDHIPRGALWTQERKEFMRGKMAGANNPMYGVSLVASEETRARMSARSRGAGNPSSKLSEDAVRDIRRSLQLGVTQVALAKKHNVSQGTISRIGLGKSWGSLS
jgi:hypothetical protein